MPKKNLNLAEKAQILREAARALETLIEKGKVPVTRKAIITTLYEDADKVSGMASKNP